MSMHDSLITAIAIMDEKGRSISPTGSVALWRRDWRRLRRILLESVDAIKQGEVVVFEVASAEEETAE